VPDAAGENNKRGRGRKFLKRGRGKAGGGEVWGFVFGTILGGLGFWGAVKEGREKDRKKKAQCQANTLQGWGKVEMVNIPSQERHAWQ